MKIKVDKYVEAVLKECKDALESCKLVEHSTISGAIEKDYNRNKVEKALQSLKSVL